MQPAVSGNARPLEAALALAPGTAEVFRGLLPLLAQGVAVETATLAAALGWSEQQLSELLRRTPGVELDAAGRIEGLGLTLRPTPHAFIVRGRRLYTWCALDTLMFPIVLGETAHVVSACAASGEIIRLVVTPESIESLDPLDAVMSLVVPGDSPDLRSSFCNHVSFFANERVASGWVSTYSGGVITPIATAYELAGALTAGLSPAACKGCR